METIRDQETCIQTLISPSQWIFSIVEIVLASVGLVVNTIITIICHNSVPMPISQRRLLASITVNSSILSGIHLTRNFFLYLLIHKPCFNRITTISCKIQEFPVLFCYIYFAVSFFLIGLQTLFLKSHPNDKKRYTWYFSCSVWQSTVAVVCIAISLIFTAFDVDNENAKMEQCFILLAICSANLKFALLTFLILLHLSGFILIVIASNLKNEKNSWLTSTTYSLRELMKYEALLWILSFFISGCVVVYNHVLRDPCEVCSGIILNIFFLLLPLVIIFLHPLFLVWYVLPIRDAAIQKFPCILTVFPEYSIIPPEIPSNSSIIKRNSNDKPSSSAAKLLTNKSIELKTDERFPSTKIILEEELNES